MSAVMYYSPPQIRQRLRQMFRHATASKPSPDKTVQKRRKFARRDFNADIAAVLWGPLRSSGCEL